MDERPEGRTGDLFDGVETAEGLEGSGEGLDLTPEDRPRGILSSTDREYLCGLKEYAQPQTDANRRQDIRERVTNALKDFTLLSLFLEGKEREKIFDNLGEEWTEDALISMMAFAYLGLDEDRPKFESMIEKGIIQAENMDKLFQSAGRATNSEVSITVDYKPDVEKLYKSFLDGKELTDAEIGTLVREGKLKDKDLKRLERSSEGLLGAIKVFDSKTLD